MDLTSSCTRVLIMFYLSVGDADEGGAMQAALVEISKQHTVPNIFIKGQHLGGCDG